MQRGDVRGVGNRAGERGHNDEQKRQERQQETNGLFFHSFYFVLFRPSGSPGSPGLLLLSAELLIIGPSASSSPICLHVCNICTYTDQRASS